MSLEGRVDLRVAWDGRRIVAADVAARRPQLAARLLVGRPAAEAVARVPLVFSICARAQGAAAAAAVAAARGEDAAVDAVALRRVAAECVHEALWRVLRDWPELLGDAPDVAALARLRQALAPLLKGDADADVAVAAVACRDLLAARVFGEAPADWCRRCADADLDAWLAAGGSAAARLIAGVAAAPTRILPRLLPPLSAADLAVALAGAVRRADFASLPHWQGASAETGPLAPVAPALAPLFAAHGAGVAIRLLARLYDAVGLIDRLAGTAAAVQGARAADGAGWGVVDTARGRLVHVVELADDRVLDWRIVAPTEWNFHSQGALAELLVGLAAADRAAVERHAALAVQALDPCVSHHVEVIDA